MHAYRWGLAGLAFALVLTTCGLASGQALPLAPRPLSGRGITGAFEGWFPNPDGTFSLLMGYYNINQTEAFDVPIGPDNQIQPGGPDQGQPTHFLAGGRQWGVFTIIVPKDFGDKKLTWTITANGNTSAIPLDLKPLYRLDPFRDATGKTPPYIGFSNKGPFLNGPRAQSESLKARVGTALPLTVWLADDARDPMTEQAKGGGGGRARPIVSVRWIVLRSPAPVKFDNAAPSVQKAELVSPPPGTPFNGKASTAASFSAPGDYILTLQASDATGGGPGGHQCCWSNAKVNISVAP